MKFFIWWTQKWYTGSTLISNILWVRKVILSVWKVCSSSFQKYYNHLEISSFTKKQMGLTHCLPQLVPLFAIISSTVVIFNHCLPLIVPQFAIFLSHSLPKLVSWFALVSPLQAIVSATGLIPNSLTDRKWIEL